MRYPLNTILPIARGLVKLLAPHCERIEIAGSIRRNKSSVKDIELVAIPKPYRPTFGGPVAHDALDAAVQQLFSQRMATMTLGSGRKCYGPKHRMFRLNDNEFNPTIAVDLFVVTPPAQWGSIFAIRTGPGEFNERIMRRHLKPRGLVQVDGHLETRFGQVVDTPTEADWFAALGLPLIPPEERSAQALAAFERMAVPV